ncbi:MAG: hypothetical protein ACRC3H_02670 [Lachnospiraceae bacterium]
MKVRALISFSGARLALGKGKEAEVDETTAKEYEACGYVEIIETTKATKKTAKGGGGKGK